MNTKLRMGDVLPCAVSRPNQAKRRPLFSCRPKVHRLLFLRGITKALVPILLFLFVLLPLHAEKVEEIKSVEADKVVTVTEDDEQDPDNVEVRVGELVSKDWKLKPAEVKGAEWSAEDWIECNSFQLAVFRKTRFLAKARRRRDSP
jgi:hypothetical protein